MGDDIDLEEAEARMQKKKLKQPQESGQFAVSHNEVKME